MKKILLIQLFGLYSLLLFSQNYVDVYINQPAMLEADAGIDTTIAEGTTIQIGGSPTATYGYGGYMYSWAPSDNLNDASSSNPEATAQYSIIYYVTVTDIMGCTSRDSVAVSVGGSTGMLNQWIDPGIRIVPNPNQGTFIIEMNNRTFSTGIDIIIRDMNGKMVYNRISEIDNGKNNIPVNISTLPEGNYIIELYHESLQYTQKLVVY